MQSIDILYQDEHFIAINKPSGLFVHKSEFDRRADYALKYVREIAGSHVWPVHRLDRPTSGVLVFALSKDANRLLSACFRDKHVEKKYVAVVRGYTEEKGDIDYPLRVDKGSPLKDAVTIYNRLKTAEIQHPVGRYNTARYSLVEIIPHTGRYHQIRKHFAHIFHPVAGDSVHGDGKHNSFIRDRFHVNRLLLAATELCFGHPFTEKQLSIKAPVEQNMQRVIDEMFV